MEIEFDDIITISFIERCDGEVVDTNIKEIARESGIYDEKKDYIPFVTRVGGDDFPEAFYDEITGKEVGAKGTIILPPEKAYGERNNEKIHSVHKKDLKTVPKIGEIISEPDYGDGVVVNKIGSQFIIDFNHKFAGKDIEYEYEVHERITDPAEQFFRLLDRFLEREYDASFEDEVGTISVTISAEQIFSWNVQRVFLAVELLDKHPSLDSLEFHEEYENVIFTKEWDEDDVEIEVDANVESEGIKDGDLIVFSFIERFNGKIVNTNIEDLARNNNVYDEDYEYVPDIAIIGLENISAPLEREFIGKEVGAKGTVILPPEEAYGLRSKEEIRTINRKEVAEDTMIGSCIYHDEYGSGLVFDKIGKRFIVDFNHPLAGKEIEYEYEIFERVTEPAEQFYRLLRNLAPKNYKASFEDGKGTIRLDVPVIVIDEWNVKKINMIMSLFKSLSFLQTLEIYEKFLFSLSWDQFGSFPDDDDLPLDDNEFDDDS
ncbi:MAG: FKBP-type peptidyl-prolyl cis-trans isomerase [Methanomicrobiales archaeon]|jgi:FKBP-type peptidyl-prolyl cis-trans isomerase SlyD|nr:FKBP-type peptidyl-prolyl cis-trans isomerase [Methanomicrobiales archaeon]